VAAPTDSVKSCSEHDFAADGQVFSHYPGRAAIRGWWQQESARANNYTVVCQFDYGPFATCRLVKRGKNALHSPKPLHCPPVKLLVAHVWVESLHMLEEEHSGVVTVLHVSPP
jgi:hypothetical protein